MSAPDVRALRETREMGDPERIYLQPECCATPDVGRLWCEDDEPVECEEGRPWTEYVRADLAGDPVLAASVAAGMLERHIAALSEARFKCDGTREVSMSWQDAMAFLRSVAHTHTILVADEVAHFKFPEPEKDDA